MNTQTISQFEILDTELLANVEGGKNNALTNIVQGGTAAYAGWGLGATICTASGLVFAAPACAYFGAIYATAGWAVVTGATGGF